MSVSVSPSVAELRSPDADPSASASLEAGDRWDRPARPRPKIIRRETSQILSYYHSADAGRSESESDLYDCAYRSPSPDARGRAGSRSASPSSTYPSNSDTESGSDYGAPPRDGVGVENENGNGNSDGDGDGDRDRDTEDTDTDTNVQYGIALGSPGGDTLMNTASGTDTDADSNWDRDGTGVGTGYGSRITRQWKRTHSGSRAPAMHLPLPLHPAQPKQTERRDEQEQSAPAPATAPAPPAMAPVPDPESEVAPSPRRRMNSRGASDKRRVAIVQMDSETDGSEREPEPELEPERESLREEYRRGTTSTLSDGFGRVEAQRMRLPGQAQAQAQFSVPSSSHPPSAFPSNSSSSTKSNLSSAATSALLVRRGIVGTFALVAPPDASPSAYTNLSYFTPPLSAPAVAHPTPPLLARHESAESTSTNTTTSSSGRHQHQRSQSEAVLTGARRVVIHTNPSANITSANSASKAGRRRPGHRLRKGSRDIGIVGTSTAISPTSGTMKTDVELRLDETKARTATAPDAAPVHAAQLSPIFQTPSRSQTSLLSEGASSSGTGDPCAQSSSTPKEPKRRSQQPPPNGGSNSSNGTAPRTPRDENISPVVVGIDPKQMWQAPSLSSVAYSSYASSSGSQSPPPYVMTTSPSASSSPAVGAPSPYLYYQPGVHATAGPLPSPPRQILPPARDSPPPPRPPRLHAPSSGSSSLAKRRSDTSINSKQEPASSPIVRHPEVTSPAMTPSTTSSTLVNSQSEDSVKSKGHMREGAFPITSVIVTDATPPHLSVKRDQQERQALKRKNTMDELVKDVTAAIDEAAGLTHSTSPVSPPSDAPLPKQNEPSKEHSVIERRSGIDLRREESRSTFKGGEPLSRSSSSDYSDGDYDNVGDITVTKPLPDPLVSSPLPSPRTDSRDAYSKPQKMFDFALKRFSALPRPPSRLSVTRASPRSSLSHERHPQERYSHEHERAPTRPKVVYVAKIKSAWPDVMHFGDVTARKSPLERSLGYARKINELANHDPGLGDWVVSTKHNLTVPGKAAKRKSMSPAAVRSPTERSFTFQPRHPSRASIGSEMTFPKRVDAYVATDLLQKPSEDQTLPQGPPPTLPYPTLALGTPTQQPARLGGSASMRSIPSSLGSSKSTGGGGGGGFFASIGRKTSVKKDRPVVQGAGSAAPNKLLSKRQQTVPMPAPAPRPVQISASPSLPGGPRAPPGRVQRAQSVIAPKTTAPGTGESEGEAGQGRSIKRSPSVVPSLARNASSPGTEAAPDIDAQVGKLADLLPHADTNILAGYLRRAGGQDILAIGRYLDDEKNGVLRRD